MTVNFSIMEHAPAGVARAVFEYCAAEFPEEASKLANGIAGAAFNYWQESAKHSSSWGNRYASTLRFEPMKKGESTASVYVDEDAENFKFVQMMENGVKSWSIKDALMTSKKVRYNSKTGQPYIRVPFRWRTPAKTEATSGFAGTMTPAVYNIVSSGGVVDIETAKAEGNAHMAGLKRFGMNLHHQFLTFRTVTKQSEGWQYPSKPATPVFQKVLDKLDSLVEETLTEYMKYFTKKTGEKFQ